LRLACYNRLELSLEQKFQEGAGAKPQAAKLTNIFWKAGQIMTNQDSHTSLLRNARREVWIVLALNLLALTWTVGYSYLHGYQHDADSRVVQWGWTKPRTTEDFQQVHGLPDWVFTGIFVPWLLCTVFSIGLCVLGIQDDDLGTEGGEKSHGH
jgi:hypothetical protein